MGINNQEDDDFIPGTESTVEVDTSGKPAALEVEIVDDTPESDRGRKPLNKDVVAEVDAEADQYGEKVKKRISEMKHAVHDERRAREAAERRAAEAERLAREALQRTRVVQQQFTYGEAAYAEDSVKAAQAAVAAAKEAYKRAYDAGDPDRLVEAAEKLSEAKNRESQTQAWAAQAKQKVQRNPLQNDFRGIDSEQQHLPSRQQAPAVDSKAEKWAADNPWWNQDPEMTAAAWGVHERLTRREGIDPIRDADKYYAEIDKTMRRRFPEYDWDDGSGSEDADDRPRNPDGTFAPKKSATAPVAPVKRVSTGNPNPNKVVLTKTQVQLAEKLGITLEEYAKEWVKSQQGA